MKVYTLTHEGALCSVHGSFRDALGMVPRSLIGRMFLAYDAARDKGKWSTDYDDCGLHSWYEIREWEIEP